MAINEAVEQQQYLTFLLAEEEYAINILQVKEILEYDVVTAVPKCPKWIRGVFNLRGGVVPVVDLAVKFGLEPRKVTKTTCIVIVEVEWENVRTSIGVIADAVSQVIEIGSQSISEVPSFGTQTRPDHLLGLANIGKKFAMILDIDRVLSSQEILEIGRLEDAIQETEPPETAGEADTWTESESRREVGPFPEQRGQAD